MILVKSIRYALAWHMLLKGAENKAEARRIR
jgi:hypothetical protein